MRTRHDAHGLDSLSAQTHNFPCKWRLRVRETHHNRQHCWKASGTHDRNRLLLVPYTNVLHLKLTWQDLAVVLGTNGLEGTGLGRHDPTLTQRLHFLLVGVCERENAKQLEFFSCVT